ncbi:MAG: hypothetical protein FJX29_11415 [Alphaproteobacteria bacterium]|nr:hypothetical protein [Alphaproteobacteria bacterium]
MRKTALLILAAAALATSPAFAQDIKPEQIVRPANAPAAPKIPLADLLKRGEVLFSDKRLSKNDQSCATCHANYEGYNDTFKQAYPHPVAMTTDMLKLGPVNAETMVQFCLMAPMEAPPLAWGSPDLAALTAYVEKVREEYAKRK